MLKNVVVQLYPWFKLYFLLFLDMAVYDNEFETKKLIKTFKKGAHATHVVFSGALH